MNTRSRSLAWDATTAIEALAAADTALWIWTPSEDQMRFTGATRALGKVSQIGLAGGTARFKVLENSRFEVQFEATLWGTIKELREVIALAESGALSSIPIERVPLERINDVYERLKRGEVQGRAVITPAA